jgi:hypothetical protein
MQAERLDLAPELRLASYTYEEIFGCPPAVVWHVPGTLALLASGPLRLTVAARWGAIVAAGPQPGDVLDLVRSNRPGERVRLTVAQAAAGGGPPWAGAGLRSASAGASLLVITELPTGSGLGVATAVETAIRLCLGDPDRGGELPAGALLGSRWLPFDLDAAGLRLVVIDTRVRGVWEPPPEEHSPVEAAAAALRAGSVAELGPMLTAAHRSLARDVPDDDVREIAVRAALGAGALGARMITDGPGRPVCALLPADRLADLRTEVVTEFTRAGLRSPRVLTFSHTAGPQRA